MTKIVSARHDDSLAPRNADSSLCVRHSHLTREGTFSNWPRGFRRLRTFPYYTESYNRAFIRVSRVDPASLLNWVSGRAS